VGWFDRLRIIALAVIAIVLLATAFSLTRPCVAGIGGSPHGPRIGNAIVIFGCPT
jgi:hypothetical protein